MSREFDSQEGGKGRGSNGGGDCADTGDEVGSLRLC